MSSRATGRTPAPRPPAASEPRGRTAETPAERPGTAVRFVVGRTDPPEHLFRSLLSAYLGGAPALEVVERPSLSAGSRQVVREFCRRTRGSEILQDGREHLLLRIAEPAPRDSVDDDLRALGTMVLAFHREAVASWDALPLGREDVWERRDDEIDRAAWHLERRLALGEGLADGSVRAATVAWTVARSLERIADHAVTLGETGARLAELGADAGRRVELEQFHRQAMAHLAEVLALSDGAGANDLLDVGEALAAGGRALTERLLPAVGDRLLSPAAAGGVGRALEAIGRTIAYGQDIAQAFFDRAAPGPGGRPALVAAAPAVA